MEFNIKYVGEIATESRKMRTTRGAGFTTLKVGLRATVRDSEMPISQAWPSMTAACDAASMPEAMADLNADRIGLTWGYWYRDGNDALTCAFCFHITYEDRGHAKRAEVGRLVLKRLQSQNVEATFVRGMMERVFEETRLERAREEAARELAWMAAGIVDAARREAMNIIGYSDKLATLRRSLACHTENGAIDMVSAVSREHGVDEAELKLAVEKALAEPAHFFGRY
jgi:hypothetical protein